VIKVAVEVNGGQLQNFGHSRRQRKNDLCVDRLKNRSRCDQAQVVWPRGSRRMKLRSNRPADAGADWTACRRGGGEGGIVVVRDVDIACHARGPLKSGVASSRGLISRGGGRRLTFCEREDGRRKNVKRRASQTSGDTDADKNKCQRT
jgi:hypothetical protein